MKREEKSAVIDELAEEMGGAQAIFAVDYKGISVAQAAELRSKLRESDAQFKVVKNRLAKLAAAKAGTEGIDDLLRGPIALTLIKGDAVVAAKTITTFTREHEILEYRGGFMDGEALDNDSFQAIARLPGRDVLHGQLVGLIASPLTGLAAGMSNMISGLGRQLAQIAEQGLVSGSEADASPAEEAADSSGEAPEPEAPVEEPTPEEAPVEEPPTDEPAPEPEAAEEPSAESDETEAEEPSAGSDPEAEAEEPSAGSDPETEAEGAPEPDEGSDPTEAAGEEPETETENETPEED